MREYLLAPVCWAAGVSGAAIATAVGTGAHMLVKMWNRHTPDSNGTCKKIYLTAMGITSLLMGASLALDTTGDTASANLFGTWCNNTPVTEESYDRKWIVMKAAFSCFLSGAGGSLTGLARSKCIDDLYNCMKEHFLSAVG